MRKPISREEEAALPAFDDSEEAYRYFKKRYGDDFRFQGVEETGDGGKYWHCHLVLDQTVYQEGMRALSQGKPFMGLKLIESYQTVELMESGHVHIVH